MTADRITALEEALRPFALLEFSRTDEAWEAFYNASGHTWIDYDHIQTARAALAASRTAPDCRQPDLVTPIPAERAGWNAAIAWVEKYLADYVSEHGIYDHSTGVTEFPDGGEWAGSVQEIIDGMRLAMPAALDLTPAPAVEPVALTAQDAARDVELLLSAYKGLLVLHRIMMKSGLHAGEKTTSELADRIVAAHPEFPARAALRAIGGDA